MSETFVMDADWLEFHPNPKKPSFQPPAGAIDAHCHVFGPGDQFPFAPERKYTPCDATKDQLWSLREHLGLSKNVIVQATCHGSDNRALLDALTHSEDKARGVATVKATITDAELAELHRAGVRGIRFNFVKRLVSTRPTDALISLAPRINKLGWHVVVYFEAEDLTELAAIISKLPVTVVIDHMARPNISKGVDSEEFASFLQLLKENEHVWTKVSCPERLTKQTIEEVQANGYSDVVPFAKTVVEECPNRVLWGTDWPHPNMKSHMPDDGVLVELAKPGTNNHSKSLKLRVIQNFSDHVCYGCNRG